MPVCRLRTLFSKMRPGGPQKGPAFSLAHCLRRLRSDRSQASIIVAFLTFALLHAADAETPGPPPERFERVTVTSVSPPPGFVFGFIATFVEISGKSPRTGELKAYAPYLRIGQDFPKPGQICDITIGYWNFSGLTA